MRKAVAFKDRLLEYDATHEQRTVVVGLTSLAATGAQLPANICADDHADYFDYEETIWLSPEEKQVWGLRPARVISTDLIA